MARGQRLAADQDPDGLSFDKTSSARQVIDSPAPSGHNPGSMITLLLHLLWLLPFLVGGHRQLALENLALRQQLAVYRRLALRPRLGPADRLFWAGLARVWTGWRRALVIVSPDTVLRWHRRRFREYWSRVSFAERLIGSIRRECLNHVLVLGERHLRRTLSRYFSYSHQARTHLALDKDAPTSGRSRFL